MKNMVIGTYVKGEELFNFSFYTDISASMKIRYVNSVVELLVDDMHYNSIIKDLISDFCLIDTFTDIDLSDIVKSDAFLDDAEQLLTETNIVEIVKENMKDGLLDELNNAVNLSIEHRTGIHISPLAEAVARLLSTINKKVSEIDFANMPDMSEMASVIQKLMNMEDTTTEGLLNAYMNSDLYKNVLSGNK